MSQLLLDVNGLTMRFGGLVAVNGVNLKVKNRQIVSVIGPNGAGKTTVFNCLSGFYIPTEGSVMLKNQQIAGLKDYQISRKGLVRTFQHVRLFQKMTVIENMLVAQHRHLNTNLFSGLLKTPNYRRLEKDAMEHAAHWLKEVRLLDYANREAGNLSYGQQRRLEIARCMVTQPELLMLDEPAAGLNPNETKELDELIISLRDEHEISILLIEHDMSLVMGISDHIYVIAQGTPLADGNAEQIKGNPDVIKAYLGEE
ncbi:high-affinity branched-chain amino acid ABC transporter ATP-binding protein LivG [uncultured Amphritea sp.]|uniref:high-affinity branched-chain amino acid ABC transporter ATP-binding protein LivG n=1 Tax=uncultured Amphritea sp. TaxID=981605 RepID=UPI00262DF36B|nr:high-affinity branched-chain amino acid ABC transporter ATP-binding protein LivG [uncultured Amphritea sp.]